MNESVNVQQLGLNISVLSAFKLSVLFTKSLQTFTAHIVMFIFIPGVNLSGALPKLDPIDLLGGVGVLDAHYTLGGVLECVIGTLATVLELMGVCC